MNVNKCIRHEIVLSWDKKCVQFDGIKWREAFKHPRASDAVAVAVYL